MKVIRTIFSVLSNKYLLALGVFVVMLLFVNRNDIFVQWDRKRELKELNQSKAFYQAEIEKTRKQLADLQNNPAALEKYARENLFMKKDNEDVFIIEQPSAAEKK